MTKLNLTKSMPKLSQSGDDFLNFNSDEDTELKVAILCLTSRGVPGRGTAYSRCKSVSDSGTKSKQVHMNSVALKSKK